MVRLSFDIKMDFGEYYLIDIAGHYKNDNIKTNRVINNFMIMGVNVMGPLVFWLGSILESFIFTRLNSRRLYKDLADRGYKLKYMDGQK